MPNKIVKNKKQYMLGKQGVLNSQAGDEAALEALYTSANGASWTNNTGWASSGMSLDGNIHGITTATINGELRVTEIDLRLNNLTGSIDTPNLGNLKQMTLFNVQLNSLYSAVPEGLTNCDSLRYCYLCGSDDVADIDVVHPHEEAQDGITQVHSGKDKGNEHNVFTGAIPEGFGSLQNLEWFHLNWTDEWAGEGDRGADNRNTATPKAGDEPENVNGITSIPDDIFKAPSLVFLSIYENWNIAASGNIRPLPPALSNRSTLEHLYLGGGSGTTWDGDVQGHLNGTWPDVSNLTSMIALKVHRCAELSGFPNFSGATEMETFHLPGTDMLGGDFPAYIVDGTMWHADTFSFSWPSGQGFTGTLPDFGNLVYMDRFDVTGHEFTGSIPATFWTARNGQPVTKSNFAWNNFTSIGLTDFSSLTNDFYVRVYGNDIEGEQIPNLDWEENNGPMDFNYFLISINRYVFQDMLYIPTNQAGSLTALELYLQKDQEGKINNFSYDGQKPAGTANTYTTTDGNGDIVIDDFNTTYGHVDNSYQWQKLTDGGSTWSDIAGATSKSYTITGATTNDNGLYRVQVTNSTEASLASTYNKTAQTLTSKEITVSL